MQKKANGDNRMSNNRRKKKLTKRQRRKRKLITFAVEILVILILLAALFVLIKLNKINNTGELDKDKLNINIDAKTQEMLDGYTNIAIFGLDNRNTGNYDGGNSDCIMIASINNDTKEVKLLSVYRDSYLDISEDTFKKLNSAYAKGGPDGAVGALNKNMDLNIEEYVAVDFNAVAEVIDELGGIELTFTGEEAEKTQQYVDELNQLLGTNSSYIPGEGTYLCDGVQATAYSRLRYTAGDDFKRTERQRIVVSKIVEKAKKSSLTTINSIIDKVFPDIKTSLKTTEILALASKMMDYELVDTQGWPFQLTTADLGKKGSVVVPTDLETNVILLHEYLFGEKDYEPTDVVKDLSDEIIRETGKDANDTVIDTNPLNKEEESTEE